MKNITVRHILLSILILIQGCISYKSRVDLNSEPIAHKNDRNFVMLKKLDPRITAKGEVTLNPFKYKTKSKNKEILIWNPKVSKLSYNLKNTTINTIEKKDSLYLKTKGAISVTFNRPLAITVIYGSFKGKAKKIYIDTLHKHKPVNDLIVVTRFNLINGIGRKSLYQDADTTLNGIVGRITNTIEVNLKTPDIDKVIEGMGDLNPKKWSQDIFWKGETKILSITSREMKLQSRVEYQQWGRSLGIKTRLAKDTKTVTYTVKLNQSSGKLKFSLKIGNIKHFPGEFEDLIKKHLSVNAGLKNYRININDYEFQQVGDQEVKILVNTDVISK